MYIYAYTLSLGFPGGSNGKASVCNARDPGSIPGLGRCPGEGKGNPLQYSCLGHAMDGGCWQAAVHGVAKSRTRLSDSTTGSSRKKTGLLAIVLAWECPQLC